MIQDIAQGLSPKNLYHQFSLRGSSQLPHGCAALACIDFVTRSFASIKLPPVSL